MKNILILSLLLLMVWKPVLSQNNTTPCTAQQICPDQLVTGTPNSSITFGVNQLCSQLSPRPTLFYRVTITSPGEFTFMIRPGSDQNSNGFIDQNEIAQVDYDWAVWLNTACGSVTTTSAVRLSFDAPQPFITGMSVTEPSNNFCEGAQGDGLLRGINVGTGDQLLIAINFFSNGQIPPFQLIVGGSNGGGGNAGYDGMKYDLVDKDGNLKTQFCIGEDILLNGFGGRSKNYKIELFQGTNSTPLASTPLLAGSPDGASVSDVFASIYSSLQIGIPYKIKLSIKSPCGWDATTKEFQFMCCASSTDASFTLMNVNGILQGHSTNNGSHTWEIYQVSPYTGNILSSDPIEGDFNDRNFLLDLEETGPCYYIKHTLSNACGEACASQRFCNFNCTEKECNLNKPTGLSFNSVTKELSWNPVTGAGSYIIQVYVCDPACCTGDPLCPISTGPIAYPPVIKNIPVQDISYTINYQTDLGLDIYDGACFSWKVIAVCPDGSTSVGSATQCSEDISGDPQGKPNADHTGVEAEHEASKNMTVKLFPNPTKGTVSIDVNAPDDVEFSVKVFDRIGRVVKTFDQQKTTDKRSTIKWNTTSLSKGVYLVKIFTSDDRVITEKLIVE